MTTAQVIAETVVKIAFYVVFAYGIHAAKAVIIAFINRRTELLDMFAPRTPEEVTIDNLRRSGIDIGSGVIEPEVLEVH